MDIEKKIEEFDNTFWLELIKYDSELAKRVRYWLKQKLTEAKREGQAKVYQLIETRLAYDKFFKEKSKEPDCDKVCLEIFKDCQKKLDKLKKLEGE